MTSQSSLFVELTELLAKYLLDKICNLIVISILRNRKDMLFGYLHCIKFQVVGLP